MEFKGKDVVGFAGAESNFSNEVPSLEDLKNKDTVSAQELLATFRDYADSGAAISAEMIEDLISQIQLLPKEVSEMQEIAIQGAVKQAEMGSDEADIWPYFSIMLSLRHREGWKSTNTVEYHATSDSLTPAELKQRGNPTAEELLEALRLRSGNAAIGSPFSDLIRGVDFSANQVSEMEDLAVQGAVRMAESGFPDDAIDYLRIVRALRH